MRGTESPRFIFTRKGIMASVNRVFILGNLGRDPETRFMPNGNAVSDISVATTTQWKDKDSGEKKSETEWHSVTFFGRLAEVVEEYLSKGSQVYIEGRLKTEKWQDKETGADRYRVKIIADSMQMLGNKEERDEAPRQPRSQAETPNPRTAPKAAPKGGMVADLDDDIPF